MEILRRGLRSMEIIIRLILHFTCGLEADFAVKSRHKKEAHIQHLYRHNRMEYTV